MLCAQQIIEALKARLLNGTDADSRVYSDRLWPLDDGKLPAIKLYELQDTVTPQTVHYPVLERHDALITVDLCAKAESGIDAVVNALRLQVLNLLFDTLEHSTLGLTNVEMSLQAVSQLVPVEGSDLQLARRSLQLLVRYSTFAHQPETFV